MKIIHTADLHIGSAFSNFTDDAKKIRTNELLNSFERLVKYAHEHSINIVLLSGDVFDKDKVNKSDKDYFYQIIAANHDITFMYLKGNHDINSLVNKEDIPNLKLFKSSWKSYEFDNVVISGIELDNENKKFLSSTLNLEKNKYNIVLLHCDIKDVLMSNFKNKYIDYIALGHIHSYSSEQLDTRGVYVYSGCLEGRGFDELGDKGFVVIDTDSDTHEFVPFATRKVYEKEVDITGTSTLYDAVSLIERKMDLVPKGSIARTLVTGKVDYSTIDLENRLTTSLSSKFLHYEVKNKSTKIIKIEDYEYDISLRGEVIRTILSKDLSEDQQNAILDDCMKLLNGEDIEI